MYVCKNGSRFVNCLRFISLSHSLSFEQVAEVLKRFHAHESGTFFVIFILMSRFIILFYWKRVNKINVFPVRFPNNKDTHGINTVRMARVWMDEYIDLFYLNRPDLKVII